MATMSALCLELAACDSHCVISLLSKADARVARLNVVAKMLSPDMVLCAGVGLQSELGTMYVV